MPGHKWGVSWDNNRAGYWTCSICGKQKFFMGIPDPMVDMPEYVQDWCTLNYPDSNNLTCKELVVVAVQTC